MWQHAAALAFVLLALVPIVGTDSAFVTDESFVVIQLDHLGATGSWTLPHPLPEVDPEGRAFPLHGASEFEGGFTLYGKHPALIYLSRPVHEAFGLVGLMILSVLGTVVAAGVAGLLARRVRPAAGPAALWLVGLASPLFFDSFVIHAHTLAAATAALATLWALDVLERPRVGPAAGMLLAALATGLLRTEGVLFAVALGAVVAVIGLQRRRMVPMLGGAMIAVMGVAARVIDRTWAAEVAGSPAVSGVSYTSSGPASFLAGRSTSGSFTLLMPGYRGGTLPEMLTFAGACLLIAGFVVMRRRPSDVGAVVLPLAGSVLLAGRCLMLWGPVPGLVPAFAVGVAGLCLVPRPAWKHEAGEVLAAVAVLFGLAVGATQYAVGGHTEWGGRYFALAVPLIGALAAAGLVHAATTWTAERWRPAAAALVVAAIGLGGLSLSTLVHSHDRNRGRVDAVFEAAGELPDHGDLPVIVTEDEQLPRLARGRYDDARFLWVPRPYLDTYLPRLAKTGVDDLLLVSVDPAATVAALPDEYEVVGGIAPYDLQYDGGGGVLHLHRAGG